MSFLVTLVLVLLAIALFFYVGVPFLAMLATVVLFWPRTSGIALGVIVSAVVLYAAW